MSRGKIEPHYGVDLRTIYDQAVAFYLLKGDVDGFPEVELPL